MSFGTRGLPRAAGIVAVLGAIASSQPLAAMATGSSGSAPDKGSSVNPRDPAKTAIYRLPRVDRAVLTRPLSASEDGVRGGVSAALLKPANSADKWRNREWLGVDRGRASGRKD